MAGNSMKKIKVIVCGTGFGKYYLEAVRRLDDRIKLAGIFSRGSRQSAHWAELLGVPMYTSFAELDEVEIDLVCVVIKSEIVGGNGTEVTEYFLKRGIHVLQEHPVHYDAYASCVRLARKNGCRYRINTFYPYLKSVRGFLKTLDNLRSVAKISYVRAECGIQVLFPMIDILGRITGNMASYQLEKSGQHEDQIPFAVIRGTIGGIPIMLLVKNEMDTRRVESNIALLHQINVSTSRGNLTLSDVHGEVLWTPVIHEKLRDPKLSGDLKDIPVQQVLCDAKGVTMGQIFEELWPDSVGYSMSEYLNDIEKNTNAAGEHQHYLSVCKAWNEIGRMLGAYHPVMCPMEEPVALMIGNCETLSKCFREQT